MKINARLIFIEKNYIVSKNLFKIYQSAVDSFMYTMLNIKSNIAFVFSMIFRYIINFINAHHFMIKRIFRYLRIIVN